MSRLASSDSSVILGASILTFLVVFALIVPVLGFDQPALQDLTDSLAPPTLAHPFGTDQFGRDMLSRIASGVRLSLGLSIASVLISAMTGVTLAVLAAWGNKWLSGGINAFANIIMSVPGLVLILIIAAIKPGSFLMLYLGIALTLWCEYYRVVKNIVIPIVRSSPVQASQLLGFGYRYIFCRHIWPEIRHKVWTLASFGAATSILLMSATGFVYAGLKPPTAELGLMITELFPYFSQAPWLLMQPITVLFCLILSFHLLAGSAVSDKFIWRQK
ncbi:ABC transporter permease [Klebsiella aerogenes]|uniref:ABC transporter permease n=1 Tax=Klebsiella aerogenes TaxID=548 RepID=A0AAP9R1I2_KLEAE|nr:ABC transporter permease [Klebsiella aerogenes]